MAKNIYKIGKELFITSNEEIKDGDWYISILENEVYKATKETQNIMSVANLIGTTTYKNTHFKIIITTDQDLIKDGVQSIIDEFLEWFVNNPSCEEIEVVTHYPTIDDEGDNSLSKQYYTLTIPKEEPKQETTSEGFHRIYKETDYREFDFVSFKIGVEWQKEQDKKMYSEEEVRKAIQETITLMRYKATEFREHEDTVIEQFKKK
jgi:hypothetical protein